MTAPEDDARDAALIHRAGRYHDELDDGLDIGPPTWRVVAAAVVLLVFAAVLLVAVWHIATSPIAPAADRPVAPAAARLTPNAVPGGPVRIPHSLLIHQQGNGVRA